MASAGGPPHSLNENRGPGILVTSWVVSALSSVVTALRLITRIWIVRSVGFDDYTIVCATFGVIISSGLVTAQVHHGFGRHRIFLSKRQYSECEKYSYGEWIQMFQTLMFTKLSICFFLLRIPIQKYFIRPIQGAIVVLIVSNVILTLLWVFQCNPIAGAWNKRTPSKCFTEAQLQRIIFSQAIISIASDFALALFPIALLWNVQMSLRIKAGLCSLMALGLITAACCIVRTIINWQNINSDPTWTSVDNWYWRSQEVCIGIIAACIPALRPGYKTVTSSLRSYISHHRSQKSSAFDNADMGRPMDPLSDRRPFAQHKVNLDKRSADPLRAAELSAATEIERAMRYGAGEEGFVMQSTPDDKRPLGHGIRKTTEVDIDIESQKSVGPEEYETMEGSKLFV